MAGEITQCHSKMLSYNIVLAHTQRLHFVALPPAHLWGEERKLKKFHDRVDQHH